MIFICILIASGCNLFYGDSPSSLHTNLLPNVHNSETNYLINGRVMFKNIEGSHSGEMMIQIFNNSGLTYKVAVNMLANLIFENK